MNNSCSNNREQCLLTTVVDRVQHNIVASCWEQHCNKLLTTLIKLFIFARVHSQKRTTCSGLMKTGSNNVVLPTLFNVVNNIVQHCWAWISPQSGVTMLNNIVDNIEQCGQHNIVQGCFHQPWTGCAFLRVYTRKNWSGWCNVVRWTTPEQCCHQGSTTLVELTMLMSIVRSTVVRCWQRTIIVTMLLEQGPTIVDETSLLMVVRTMLFSVVKSSCQNNVVSTSETSVDELTGCCKLLKQLLTTLVNDKMFWTSIWMRGNDFIGCYKLHDDRGESKTNWQIQTDFSWTESDGPFGNIKHLNCNKNLVSVVYYTT